jgi:dTDP-4-dehydrorhamnose 3,5-epimerase
MPGVATNVIDFEVSKTAIDGLLVLCMKQVTDERGAIREFFRESGLREAGVYAGPWRQINVTQSRQGTIRGLHGEAMTKLVAIVSGEAFGVYADARPESSTTGVVATVRLVPGTQVLVPSGVCNGFQSLSAEPTQYLYCFDTEWAPGMAGVAVNPFDAELGIDWPITIDREDRSVLSAKDAAAPTFAEVLARS